MPSLRVVKSVLENDSPPILIVLAFTSITDDVIYWKAPEMAVILAEAVIEPVTYKSVKDCSMPGSPLIPWGPTFPWGPMATTDTTLVDS